MGKYLHGLETKVVVVEVSVVNDSRIELLCISHDDLISLLGDHRTWLIVLGIDVGVEIINDLRELLLGLFVQVRNGNTIKLGPKAEERLPGSKNGIIWMLSCHVSSSLGSKVVKLNGSNTLIINIEDFENME